MNVSKIKSIEPWLVFLIYKLGAKSTIFLLKELDNKDNKLLFRALYWLPSLIHKRETKATYLLQELIKEHQSHNVSEVKSNTPAQSPKNRSQ